MATKKTRCQNFAMHSSPQSNSATFLFSLSLFPLFIFRQLLKLLCLSFGIITARLCPFILFPLRRQKTKKALGHCKWEMKNTHGERRDTKKERRQNKEGKNGERVCAAAGCFVSTKRRRKFCVLFIFHLRNIIPRNSFERSLSKESSSRLCVLHPWAIIAAAPSQRCSRPRGVQICLEQVELETEEKEREAIHHWFGLSRSHHLAAVRATKMDHTPRWAAPQCFCCTSASVAPANTHPTTPWRPLSGPCKFADSLSGSSPTDENQHLLVDSTAQFLYAS